MQRMTDVLSRMLNDPATRAALSGGGEDSLEDVIEQQEGIQNADSNIELNTERSNESAEMDRERNDNLEITGNKLKQLCTIFIFVNAYQCAGFREYKITD